VTSSARTGRTTAAGVSPSSTATGSLSTPRAVTVGVTSPRPLTVARRSSTRSRHATREPSSPGPTGWSGPTRVDRRPSSFPPAASSTRSPSTTKPWRTGRGRTPSPRRGPPQPGPARFPIWLPRPDSRSVRTAATGTRRPSDHTSRPSSLTPASRFARHRMRSWTIAVTSRPLALRGATSARPATSGPTTSSRTSTTSTARRRAAWRLPTSGLRAVPSRGVSAHPAGPFGPSSTTATWPAGSRPSSRSTPGGAASSRTCSATTVFRTCTRRRRSPGTRYGLSSTARPCERTFG
jgi:hypothetical protein